MLIRTLGGKTSRRAVKQAVMPGTDRAFLWKKFF
jgi:hypothetical protein